MQTLHTSSFRELSRRLLPDADLTWIHHWQNSLTKAKESRADFEPGATGTSEVPKYLYRGEPGVFATSESSWGRLQRERRFDAEEMRLLEDLAELAAVAFNVYIEAPPRAIAWAQHYGLPTYYVDLTSDPTVALHFAADAGADGQPETRVVYRIDLEAIEDKTYGKAGAPTPLTVVGVENVGISRASLQRAWAIGSNAKGRRLDLRSCSHLASHAVRFEVDAQDASEFLRPELLSAINDGHASWPLAVVRALHFCHGGPLPQRLVEWLCRRIPLFDQPPTEVTFDENGYAASVHWVSPAEAKERDGRDYAVAWEDAVRELTSAVTGVPNGLVVGMPVEGPPGERVCIERDEAFSVVWLNEMHDWTRQRLPKCVKLR